MTAAALAPPRLVPVAILAVSLAALAWALASQYVFGFEPCVLCLYQRLPYVATTIFAAAALVLPVGGGARAAVVALCAATFLGGAGVAFFHVGVEEHWWPGTAGCGGVLAADVSVEDLRAALADKAPKACDEVDWRLFGLSLAGYNTILSLMLAAGCLVGARTLAKRAER